MHSAIESMLELYKCETTEDYFNALKEVIQEITLLGLYRGDFFRHAAFYGGTALRFFYGINRFSEDLDFSLLHPDPNFDLSRNFLILREELNSYGLDITVEKRIRSNKTPIQSALIKGGTRIHLLKLKSISPPVSGVNPNQLIKIKLEVDTDPPAGGAGIDQISAESHPLQYPDIHPSNPVCPKLEEPCQRPGLLRSSPQSINPIRSSGGGRPMG